MAKTSKKIMTYNDVYFGDFPLDVPRISRHAIQRAAERKIPVPELLKPRSHINGYIDKVVAKNGLVITAYPRATLNPCLPENARCFNFPEAGIGLFIGKQHQNIKRTQAEYQLQSLYFDKNNKLVAVPPTPDYDWTSFEVLIQKACKRKYKPQSQRP